MMGPFLSFNFKTLLKQPWSEHLGMRQEKLLSLDIH